MPATHDDQNGLPEAGTALAVLLNSDQAIRQQQLSVVEPVVGQVLQTHIQAQWETVQPLQRCGRLALLTDALPALKSLTPSRAQTVLEAVKVLLRQSERINLTQYLYARLIRDALGNEQPASAHNFNALRDHARLLLSLLARASSRDPAEQEAAYAAGLKLAPLDGLGTLDATGQVSTRAIDRALDALSGTAPGFRRAMVQALAAVAHDDGQITQTERELLQTMAAALGHADAVLAANEPAPAPELPTPEPTQTTSAPTTPAASIASAASIAALAGVATPSTTRPEPEPLTVKSVDPLPASSWKDLDKTPAIALVTANLIPLAGVVLLGWDVSYLLLLYWLENLVIGGATLIRILNTGGIRAIGDAAFFTVHYGFFCAGHGMFVIALSNMGDENLADLDFQEGDIPFLVPLYLFFGVLRWINVNMPELFFIPLLALLISHGISLYRHHFKGREDEGREVDEIMFDPYPRLAVLHVSIILGGFFVISSGGGQVAAVLVLVVLGKTGLDLYLHRRSHERRARRQQTQEATEEKTV